MTNIFINISWSGPLLWVLLYISDYSLTLIGARAFRAQNIIRVEGSYELNPVFQNDIDSLRRVSPRFLLALCLTTGLLYSIWLLVTKSGLQSEFYLFGLGSMIMIQLAIHIRHFQGWFLYRNCTEKGGIQGHIEYPRKLILRISSLELFQFGLLFLVIFLFTFNWLLLGGAASCISAAFRQHKMAKKLKIKTSPA